MLPAQETRYIAAKTEEFSTAFVRHEPDFLGPNFQRLGTLDSHMISNTYKMPLNSLRFSDRERPWMPPVCPGFGPQSTRALSGNYFRSWPEAIIRFMIFRNAAMGGERIRSGGNLGRKTRWSVNRAARLHGAQKCQSARGAVASRSSRSVILEEFQKTPVPVPKWRRSARSAKPIFSISLEQ